MNFLTMNFLTMDRSSNAKFRLGSLIKGIIFAIGVFPWVSVACAQVEFLGSTKLSGETTDKSGLSGMLETNTPINAFGGLSYLAGYPDRPPVTPGALRKTRRSATDRVPAVAHSLPGIRTRSRKNS